MNPTTAPTLEITREQWLKFGDQAQRERWATELPLAWALEYQPTILLPGKGLVLYDPWPFQAAFLQCRDIFRAINKPRQCGISTTVAVDVAWEFDNVPGAQIVVISKDQDAAINFHKYVRQILFSVRRNNPNAPKITKDNTRETENELGNRIVSLAASKEAGRSFSATHLVLDELAFIVYADDIWQAANATLAQTGGRVTVISTPKGRANLFYRIFEETDHLGFTIFQYGWWDVPTYNPFYSELVAAVDVVQRKRAIEKAKTGDWYKKQRPKYTDLAWRQEFEGAFDANAGTVFGTRALERTFERNYLTEVEDPAGILTEWYTLKPGVRAETGKMYACAIDLGRKNDPTVILTYDYTQFPARLVDYKYIEAGRADWELIDRASKEHLKAWQPDALHDGTGAGDAVTDSLAAYSEPFFFTKNSKQGIIERVQHAMDHGMIIMPKIPRLYREHQRYIWDDKDIQQDTVMANAMAISIFYDTDSAFIGFDKDINFVGSV